jgi:hypothetical protein
MPTLRLGLACSGLALVSLSPDLREKVVVVIVVPLVCGNQCRITVLVPEYLPLFSKIESAWRGTNTDTYIFHHSSISCAHVSSSLNSSKIFWQNF